VWWCCGDGSDAWWWWCEILFLQWFVPVKKSVLGGGVNFGGCCPQGCFLGCSFRVFRLYTTPFVCMLSFTDLYSSCAGIWLFIKICCFKKKIICVVFAFFGAGKR